MCILNFYRLNHVLYKIRVLWTRDPLEVEYNVFIMKISCPIKFQIFKLEFWFFSPFLFLGPTFVNEITNLKLSSFLQFQWSALVINSLLPNWFNDFHCILTKIYVEKHLGSFLITSIFLLHRKTVNHYCLKCPYSVSGFY